MSLRVLVVDDTALYRRLVSDALKAIPGIEVLGTAGTGRLALERMEVLKPDLVTLDMELPEMDGLDVLRQMRRDKSPAGVILVSAHTRQGGELTLKALELGAFDFVTKPSGSSLEQNRGDLQNQLQPKIRAFEQRRVSRALTPARLAPSPPAPPAAQFRRRGDPVVLIGVSTGGPAALAEVLPALPAGLGAPVFVVQHMPPLFTAPLAESLAKRCTLPVKEASDGERGEPDRIYIAPGGRQMKLQAGPGGEMTVRVTDDPPENNCRPAVDTLFRSAALNFPGRATAVILTGMGEDGTLGLRLLKRSGCYAIAQDEASSVVFGMPRAAIAAGLVDDVQPLEAIGPAIVRSLREGRG